MNYSKIYDDLVAKCIVRGLDKKVLDGYFEKHHIIPKCLGGSDKKSNFVLFTPREHVIAHRLLWKANPDNYSLMWAYTRTVNSHKGILTSREVELAKIAKAKVMSERVISDETKEKIRQTLTGHKRTEESIEKGRLKQVGQKRTDETKANLKEARKRLLDSGWTVPEEARKKIGDAFRGKNISEEHKRKISEATKGKVMPAHVLEATSAYQKSLRPWQKSASKARPERAKVWAQAANYFNVWVENNNPKSWAFSTIISNIENFKYKTYHFDKLIEMFHEGWIPHYDKEWLEFHSEEVNV